MSMDTRPVSSPTSAVNSATMHPPVHPVGVTVNPLQLLWLQESGIDRLWGRPLAATHASAVPIEPAHGHAAGTQNQAHAHAQAAEVSAAGPAAAGVAPVAAEPAAIGAAREPSAAPADPQPASPSRAKEALARIRQQMEHQRGKSALRAGAASRSRPAESGQQQEPPPLTQVSEVEGIVLNKVADEVSDASVTVRDADAQWPVLSKTITQCVQCGLAEQASQPVPGSGPTDAALMIIDQVPGAQDDASGRPLSGQAGILLDNMLRAIGLARDAVFITDVVKCRPMLGRSPQPEEIDACADYLQQQMAMVQPACVLLLGNAAQSVLGSSQPVGELRESPDLHLTIQGRHVPVVVTFHPNHLMANQAAKPLAWADLKRIRKILTQTTAQG